MKTADNFSDYLMEHARSEMDIDAAKLLRKLGEIHDAAREVVLARTHDHSKAAYAELVDIFKGKKYG